jgi:uncharacterized protein (DUF1800 family)
VWWLATMLDGGHPLREKLTLFWHNHFATSYAKVQRIRLMFEQNLLLRKHALGKFRPFLLDMSRDTAMLKWLDSNQNVKGAPNENFAREVMELFSLGVGRYSEKDVQEAARAFTGWHVDSHIDHDEDTFQFKPVFHDDGAKTVFGRTGKWNGDDIVTFCCDKSDCATFLTGKLYSFLISETRPPASLLEPLAARFRKSDYDIADLVKTMLGSRLFFSEHAYRKRVKWPVEYALGAIRAAVPGRVPLGDLLDPLAKMGQVLFAPPNVKGWRTGTDWLNSATLLARNNFAETVAMGNWPRVSARGGNPADAGRFSSVAEPAPPARPDSALSIARLGRCRWFGRGHHVSHDHGPGRQDVHHAELDSERWGPRTRREAVTARTVRANQCGSQDRSGRSAFHSEAEGCFGTREPHGGIAVWPGHTRCREFPH